MVKEFTIATNNTKDNWIEATLQNLRFRLKIQEEWVAKTKAEIRELENELERLKEKGEL